MKKIISVFILSLSLCLFVACRAGQPAAAPVITEVQPQAADSSVSNELTQAPSAAESTPPPQEIPPYNDYQVSLDIDPETRLINGIERIRYTNRSEEALPEIVVRVYLNAFSETEAAKPYFDGFAPTIFANGMDYGYMNILHVSLDNDELNYTLDGTVLRIALDEPLPVEQTVLIKIQFDAYVPMIAHRTGANENAMWCGAFLPVLSVYDSEGWHTEPYYPAGDPFYLETANYTVEINTPDGYEVAGSGVKREDLLDNKKVTTFTANMTRDFAFAVSKVYKVAEATTASGVNIQFYYYSENLDVDMLMDVAERSMTYFEQTVGAYPYGQISIAETSMFVRGMEFSKIVFINSAYLQRPQNYASLVHELGHQWFYNVVGSNQMSEAWLDEGVTLFIQEGFFNQSDEDLKTALEADYKTLRDYLAKMKNDEGKRLKNNVSIYDGWTDYYQVQYMKGKMMLYALRQTMGPGMFAQFISEYYKAYSFRIATSADFINMAETVYGESLSEFFNKWLYSEALPVLP